MSKRSVVLLLSSALALTLAVPALGGPSNPVADGAASAKKTAKKALKKAGKAKKKANKANRTAKKAQTAADAAQVTADAAQSTGDAAQLSADAAQATADAAAADAAVNTGTKLGLEDVSDTSASNSTNDKVASASCPSGKDVTGGWGFVNGQQGNVAIYGLLKFYEDTSVLAAEVNATAGNWSVTAQAACINE
ncbi:MAG TPA: hypothetical protein VKA36_06875 [Solirubrobacterales bacterium]|nr:hypothetical protein [Solirubrobacterales bacterium]